MNSNIHTAPGGGAGTSKHDDPVPEEVSSPPSEQGAEDESPDDATRSIERGKNRSSVPKNPDRNKRT